MWSIVIVVGLSVVVSRPGVRALERVYKAEALDFCTKVYDRLRVAKANTPATTEIVACRGTPKTELPWPKTLQVVGRHAAQARLQAYEDWAWPMRLLAYGGAAVGVGLVIAGAGQDDNTMALGGMASLGGAALLGLLDLWLVHQRRPSMDELTYDVGRYNQRLHDELFEEPAQTD